MQAQLALLGGKHISKYLGDYHEKDGNQKQGQTFGEFNMDNWNNAQGREIAKELINDYGIKVTAAFAPDVCDLIAQKVMERMRAGKLITHPSDKRRYIPKSKKSYTTGQAAPINNSNTSNKTANPAVKPDPIRQMYQEKVNKNNQLLNKIFRNKTKSTPSGNGHRVTMKGTHVFLAD